MRFKSFLLVALAVLSCVNASAYTIYVNVPDEAWPYFYVWDQNGTELNGSWPGDVLSDNETIDGTKWYKFETDATVANAVLHDNYANRTEDITGITHDYFIKVTGTDGSLSGKNKWTIDQGLQINSKTFPDANFRAFVAKQTNTPEGGMLSDEVINRQTAWAGTQDLTMGNKNIESVQGLHYFKELESLYLNNNRLTSLDVSALTKLSWLDCSGNLLETVDLSNNPNLEMLVIGGEKFRSIDLSHSPRLHSLMINGTGSRGYDNNFSPDFTSIDLSKSSNLRFFMLCGTNIESVDLSNNENFSPSLIGESLIIGLLDFEVNPRLRSIKLPQADPLTNMLLLGSGVIQLDATSIKNLTGDCFLGVSIQDLYEMGVIPSMELTDDAKRYLNYRELNAEKVEVNGETVYRVNMPSAAHGDSEDFVNDDQSPTYVSQVTTDCVTMHKDADGSTYFLLSGRPDYFEYSYHVGCNDLELKVVIVPVYSDTPPVPEPDDGFYIRARSRFTHPTSYDIINGIHDMDELVMSIGGNQFSGFNSYKNSLVLKFKDGFPDDVKDFDIPVYRRAIELYNEEETQIASVRITDDESGATRYTVTYESSMDGNYPMDVNDPSRYDNAPLTTTGLVKDGIVIDDYFNYYIRHYGNVYKYRYYVLDEHEGLACEVPVYNAQTVSDPTTTYSLEEIEQDTQATLVADGSEYAVSVDPSDPIGHVYPENMTFDLYRNGERVGENLVETPWIGPAGSYQAVLKVQNGEYLDTYGTLLSDVRRPRVFTILAGENGMVNNVWKGKDNKDYTAYLTNFAMMFMNGDEYEHCFAWRVWRVMSDGTKVLLNEEDEIDGGDAVTNHESLNELWPSDDGLFSTDIFVDLAPDMNSYRTLRYIVRAYISNEKFEMSSPMLRESFVDSRFVIAQDILDINVSRNTIVTGVDDVNESKQVESVSYYDITGRRSNHAFDGINVVVTKYTDGTVSSRKLIK